MQRTVSIDDGEYRFELVFFPPPPTSFYAIAIETREETRDRDRKKKRGIAQDANKHQTAKRR
jgi:hypothetical protein